MTNYIRIEPDSPIPKYKQIINSFYDAIDDKYLKKDQKLPSINELTQKFQLSRDTVLTAFNELQARGIISSRPGKGYYVNKTTITQTHKIFLLFDKLTSYKEELYASIKDELKRKGSVEIFFHNFNKNAFDSLIRDSIGNYTAYVVMPIPSKSVADTLALLPKDKLYILDRGRRIYGQHFPSVCQAFKKDVVTALTEGAALLAKYKKLTLIFPSTGHAPAEIQRGFAEFCTKNNFKFEILHHPPAHIAKHEAYLVIDDNSLVNIVKQAQQNSFELGRDVGVISYNDTPLKSVVANGITTISTDFNAMGRSVVSLILNNKKDHIENPCNLVVRNSL
jgi:DNA-binding transcriptional regulator YhcF (GntR family)